MSTFNYARAVKTAQTLIRKFGGSVNIVATSEATNADPWKPGVPTENRLDGIKAVFLNYETKFIDGTKIKVGDQKVLIAAGDAVIAPDMNGWIERGTEKWHVKSVEKLNPGDTTVLYTLQVRQ